MAFLAETLSRVPSPMVKLSSVKAEMSVKYQFLTIFWLRRKEIVYISERFILMSFRVASFTLAGFLTNLINHINI